MSQLRALAFSTFALLAPSQFYLAAAQPATAASGTVTLVGERGAKVFLDGQLLGQLPLSRPLTVSAGAHRLSLEGAGPPLEAQLDVRPGRRLDVRFDRESGAIAVSQAPAAIVVANIAGVSDAGQAELQQAASRAMDEERLLRFDPAAVPTESLTPACATQPTCQLEVAGRNSVPYVLALEVKAPGDAAADWQLDARLLDPTIGDPAASHHMICTGCTATQASERLSQMVRGVLMKGMARPRGRLEIRSQPPGASVELDGRVIGKTPLSRPVWAGSAELVLTRTGYLPERQRVVVQDGRPTEVDASLQAEPVAIEKLAPTPIAPPVRYERAPRPRWRLAAGGAAIGAGGLFLGFGIGALRVNGSCISPAEPPAQQCEQLYSTSSLGTGLTIVGAALTVTGAVLLALPGARRRVQPAQAQEKGASVYAASNPVDAGQRGAHRGDGEL